MLELRIRGVEVQLSLLFPAAVVVLLSLDPSGMPLWCVAASAMHEMGHFLALLALGSRPASVSVGMFGGADCPGSGGPSKLWRKPAGRPGRAAGESFHLRGAGGDHRDDHAGGRPFYHGRFQPLAGRPARRAGRRCTLRWPDGGGKRRGNGSAKSSRCSRLSRSPRRDSTCSFAAGTISPCWRSACISGFFSFLKSDRTRWQTAEAVCHLVFGMAYLPCSFPAPFCLLIRRHPL